MSKLSLFSLYEATIEDIYNLIIGKVDKNQFNHDKGYKIPKIELVFGIISNSEPGIPLKVNIKNLLKNYLSNVKEFMDNKLDYSISDDDLYQSYGALCGYYFIFDFADENSFKIFEYNKYPNFDAFLNKYIKDLSKQKKHFTEKFKSFSKINEKASNIDYRWIKILFSKDLSSIPIMKKKKKKAKKKDKLNSSPKKDEKIYFNINVGSIENKIKDNNDFENSENANSITEETGYLDEDNQLEINQKEDNIKPEENINIIVSGEPKNKDENINEYNNNVINDLINKMENSNLTEIEKNLISIIKIMRKEFSEKTKEFSERIENLEKHQLLLYHQSALYQNSRDITKSIFYYLYKYFGFNDCDNYFQKIGVVIEYLENKRDIESLSKEKKFKIKKFLKIAFFLNKYHNKILHRLISSSTENLIKDIQKKRNLPVFPDFTYKQFLESFEYFIENIANNEEVQAVLKESYNNYMSDTGLGAIKDGSGEAIVKTKEEKIEFNLKNDEFNEVKEFLNGVQINNDNLELLCNLTSWDKGY